MVKEIEYEITAIHTSMIRIQESEYVKALVQCQCSSRGPFHLCPSRIKPIVIIVSCTANTAQIMWLFLIEATRSFTPTGLPRTGNYTPSRFTSGSVPMAHGRWPRPGAREISEQEWYNASLLRLVALPDWWKIEPWYWFVIRSITGGLLGTSIQ